jgi:hypothetical protein
MLFESMVSEDESKPGEAPMNILAINQPYLSRPGFREVFENAGHRSFSVGWYDEGCDLVLSSPLIIISKLFDLLPSDFKPDLVIYFDHSEPLRVIGLEESPIPTIAHLVDTHIHKSWHHLGVGIFDHALLAMKDYLPCFLEGPYTPTIEWLPLWAFTVGPSPDSPRAIPASFRGTIGGTHPKRVDFFDGVRTHIPGDFGMGPFFDLYGNSKIILNDCINDDLNWRVFEALASGAMLLTPRVSSETLELFPDGEALVTYEAHNVEDAVRKIRYYLEHEEERRRIAWSGYTRVKATHLAEHRARQLLSVIERVTPRSRSLKRFSAAATFLQFPTLFPYFFPDLMFNVGKSAFTRLLRDESFPELCGLQAHFILQQLSEEARLVLKSKSAHSSG